MLITLFDLIYIIFSYGLLISQNICNASHSSIIVDNGYKGMVIAFSPKITSPQNDIISKTQELIKKASDILYDASEGRAFFNEVTLLVPSTWSEVPTENIPYTRYSDADIIITEKGSDAHSFTLQFGGCGEHALPIVMSTELVLGTGDKYGDSAKLLVHEWAHYRYGVFNEFGFPNDPLYPAYYSIPGSDKNDFKVTACSDGQDFFNVITTKYGSDSSCDMSTSNETGLPLDQNCIPLPDINNNTMQSSFMYSQALNNVTKFCGSEDNNKIVHKHNVNSPNKQNVLCNGKDTWSVIKSRLDSENSVHSSKKETTFKIWRDSSPRTLIAMAKSEQMGNMQRNEWINLALFKFSKLDLPNSKLAWFTFDNNVDSTQIDWKNAEDAVPASGVNLKGTATQFDFEKVLKEGKDHFFDKSGGTFIVLIGGLKINNDIQKIESIAKELLAANIKLKIIVYPAFASNDRKHASQLFQKAISITGGSVVYIKDDTISGTQKSSVSTLNQLLKAFESVQNDYSGDHTNSYHTISEQTFNRPQKTISFNFNIDTTIMNNKLRVYFIQSYIAGIQGGVISNPKLTNPNGGTSYPLIIYEKLFGHMQGFEVTTPALVGQWHLSADVTTSLTDESVLAIAEFNTISLDEQTITAKCWLSSDAEHDPTKPLLVYVQVNQGIDGLIQDASVELVMTQSENLQNVTYELLDNGLGDPDITKGDGIYSQYIVDIKSQGYYYMTAIVSESGGKVGVSNSIGSTSLPKSDSRSSKFCCGSKIEAGNDIIGNLSRVINCGSVFVTDNYQTENYPPNTIRDLRVEKADYFNRTVDLLWTSPGGDYTSNQVNKYVIKAFHGSDNDPNLRNKIKDNFDSEHSSDVDIQQISVAQKYGEEQRTHVKVKSDDGGMYYFAVKSYDKENHGSAVSNIVVAYIKSNVLITSTTALSNEVSKAPVEGSGGSAKFAGMEWWEILAICIACLVVLVFVIVIGICFMGKKKRKSEENERREQPPQRRAPDPPRISPPLLKDESIHIENGSLTHSVEKIPNNTIINTNNYNSGSQQNLRELNVNALSPVQSWDAKDLLSHWGRVQEAKQRQEPPPVMRIEDIESASSNRSPSYASSEDENSATYTNPGTWRYQDVTARPTYIPNTYPEPALRNSLDPLRSNTPSDSGPRYSTVNRLKPTTTVSQV